MKWRTLAAFSFVEKQMVTDQLVLIVGYDIDNLSDPERRRKYRGKIVIDRYGRQIPKHGHGTANLDRQISSGKRIAEETVLSLYDRIINPELLIRRMNLTVNHVIPESEEQTESNTFEQMDLFTE